MAHAGSVSMACELTFLLEPFRVVVPSAVSGKCGRCISAVMGVWMNYVADKARRS
jgi:hypothetical protein